MDVKTERTGNFLVLSPQGRLDGHGAAILQRIMSTEMNDTIQSVIFDLKDTPYLSSAGIRVFVIARNLVKNRSGHIILCNVSEFPFNVLKMAGMDRVFQIVSERTDAMSSLRNSDNNTQPSGSGQMYRFPFEGATIEVHPEGTGPAVLNVAGSLTKVLHSAVSSEDLRLIRFSDCEYSLGLGALAEDAETARNLLGEMITLHGSIVWLPTDGNNIPDFFTPVRDTGGVGIYTGFAAALEGPFHEIFSIQTGDHEGFSLNQIYRSIFHRQVLSETEQPGIVAIVLTGRSCGIRSSGIIHPPIPENAPKDHGSIIDPENFRSWFEVTEKPIHKGETVIAFGIGVNLNGDLSQFNPEELSSLYYIHPANKGSQTLYLHTHGVVFRYIPPSGEKEIGREIRKILITGEFLDMRHLMDDTLLSDIRCGVSYISKIKMEK